VRDGRPAIFLDRDGTVIETTLQEGKPVASNDLRSISFVHGAIEGCLRLRSAGYVLALVTNQPEVARKTVDREAVESVNDHVAAVLGIEVVGMCPHDDVDGCECRKPLPGMLYSAAEQRGLALDRRSVMIGDRWKDIGAGAAAGLTTIFIDHGYPESGEVKSHHTVKTFPEAVALIFELGCANADQTARHDF